VSARAPGVDADDLHAQVEKPVQQAPELVLVSERAGQLGVPGLAAEREPAERRLDAGACAELPVAIRTCVLTVFWETYRACPDICSASRRERGTRSGGRAGGWSLDRISGARLRPVRERMVTA